MSHKRTLVGSTSTERGRNFLFPFLPTTEGVGGAVCGLLVLISGVCVFEGPFLIVFLTPLVYWTVKGITTGRSHQNGSVSCAPRAPGGCRDFKAEPQTELITPGSCLCSETLKCDPLALDMRERGSLSLSLFSWMSFPVCCKKFEKKKKRLYLLSFMERNCVQ